MSAWWDGLSMLQKLLYLVAIPSTLVMLIQTVLLLIGLGGHGDVDTGSGPIDGGVGHDLPGAAVATGHTDLPSHMPIHAPSGGAGAADHSHAADHITASDNADAAAFHLFSLRSILAFFVVFGWVGLAMAAQKNISVVITITIAFLAGAAGLYLTAWMFYAIQKLQYSGNVNLKNAVGLQGEVYIPIPAAKNGSGKVNMLLQERWLECDAVTAGEALKTGQLVVVVDMQGGSTLIVEPVQRKAG